MFEDIQKNGMQAMMKYWNDPKVLAKIGERMGDIPTSAPAEGAAAAAAPAAAAHAPAPEINDLRDAAKCACSTPGILLRHRVQPVARCMNDGSCGIIACSDQVGNVVLAVTRCLILSAAEGGLAFEALMHRYGDLEAVEDFIAVGKDVNESDQDGRTALHYAVAYNYADIAAELISNGASLEVQVKHPTLRGHLFSFTDSSEAPVRDQTPGQAVDIPLEAA